MRRILCWVLGRHEPYYARAAYEPKYGLICAYEMRCARCKQFLEDWHPERLEYGYSLPADFNPMPSPQTGTTPEGSGG